MASLRILLVDAKRSLRRAWRSLLEDTFAGCEVEEVSNAAEAWGRVRTRQYALVLADEHLPDGSGLDLLEKTRAACPDAVRVLLAEPAHHDAAREGIRRGTVHGLLPKQAPLADATATLERLMGGRKDG